MKDKTEEARVEEEGHKQQFNFNETVKDKTEEARVNVGKRKLEKAKVDLEEGKALLECRQKTYSYRRLL